MKKRKVLLTALFICFALSLQEMKAAETHKLNEDITGGSYTNYQQNSDGGVLETQSTHTSNVTDANFQNNTATSSGGAIYNAGTVNVQGSTFEGNKAERNESYNKGGGGAIYNNGTLTVDGSSFTKNKAGKGDQVWQEEGHGGAVYNNSEATITNSTFTENHARYGGAIYNSESGKMTVQGTFTGNTAQTGAAINNLGELTVQSGSKFENNSTTRYDGGAIVNVNGTLNIGDNVTFKNNNAFNAEEESGTQKGGAISSEGDGNSQVHIGNGVTFEGNKAAEGGGIGLYKHNDVTIGENVTFKNNQAGRSGGAINVYTIDSDTKASNFTIGDNALFEGNQAGFGKEDEYNPGFVFGGAISVSDGAQDESRYSSFTIGDGATFRNNKAGLDSGVYGYGGAIYNAAFKTSVGNNALFEGNTATYAGGAVSNYGGFLTLGDNAVFTNNTSDSLGGAIYNYWGSLTLGEGALFENNEASSMGGAIYNSSSFETSLKKAAFRNNKANKGGAIYNDVYTPVYGEESYASTLEIKNSSFENNTATTDGGAIYNKGTITIDGSVFTNNKAGVDDDTQDKHGGAVYNNGEATVTNSTFTGNTADYGGAVYNDENSEMTVGGTFTQNEARVRGGAIYNGGNLTVKEGSVFENNSVNEYDGGAIYTYGQNLKIEDNVTFKNNSAKENLVNEIPAGGAIASEGTSEKVSKVEIGNGVTFDGNSAVQGGALDLFSQNDVTIGDNATFKNNTSKVGGGAINMYVLSSDSNASKLEIGDNALFEGNTASNDSEDRAACGGAINISLEDLLVPEENSSFIIGDNATFRNNKAINSTVGGYGGAIYNGGADVTIGNNVLFEGNETTSYGGAVYNHGTMKIGNNAQFIGNKSGTDSGAIYNDQESSLTIGDNALFEGNTVNSYGGAIGNNGEVTVGNNSRFIGNKSNQWGGAIYSGNSVIIGENAVFIDNSATSYGGAIANYNGTFSLGEGALFEGNSSSSMGGAIFNWTTTENNIQKATFRNNTSAYGGAIYGYRGNLNIADTVFYGNSATDGGGALVSLETAKVTNSLFENNTSADLGGAIYNFSQGTTSNLIIDNSQFTNNRALYGGAIASSGANAAAEIINSYFNSNYAALTKTKEASAYNGQGGAIWYGGSSTSGLVVQGSTFANNTAETEGGAIATYKSVTVTDTSFVNNKAGDKGGAIWANDDVTVNAKDNDIVFAGNSAKDGADIYMDNSSADKAGSLNLKAAKDRNITLTGGISGAQEYKASLDGEGTVTFNSEIKNAKMEVTNGTLHLAQGSSLTGSTTVNVQNATLDTQDGAINDYSEKVFIGDNSRLKFDLSSANKNTDKFSAAEGLQSGTVKVEDFNFIPDTKVSNGVMTAADIKESLGLGDEVTLELPEKSFKALTPLRYVNVHSGENGISYTPTGNSFNDFNPSVMISSVAAQLGGYLTQLDSYDEAFRNMDMYMIMPKSMRKAMKYRNKYALEEKNAKIEYDKSAAQYDNTSVWARPYATFENVGLKGGPRVSNVAWGTYLGGDSELFELHNGWEGMWGAYVGYNGSHQAYNGVSIYQNGGTIGLTGALYKNNFFTGLTANIGANAADFSSNYGDDSFALLRTGIASKTGYNFEFADGKFIIQPSWTMSYSFINTGDYTTSGGIRVSSDPLNAMHIEPGLKFIGNGKDGWQPYAGLSIVWNFLDKTDFTASDATLPELSVKPFFKYGVGLRKLYGERFIGYGQVYVTNGGRNGVGLQFGGRWTL